MLGSVAARSRQVVERALSGQVAPGATLAVVRSGALETVDAVGFRDLARTTPLDVDAVFYAWSVTKPLIAAIALRLAERGRLELDEPVASALGDEAFEREITIRRLLNHSAGMPDYGALPAYIAALRAAPSLPWTEAAFLYQTLGVDRARRASGWTYSNLGYMLLRQVVERAGGASLSVLVRNEIAGPLGLRGLAVHGSLGDSARLTPAFSSYLDPGGPARDVSRGYHPGWVAHGVVAAPAAELALALDAFVSGRLCGAALMAQALTPTSVPGRHPLFGQTAYGLGLMLDPSSRHGLVAGHGGGGPGYSVGAFSFADIRGERVTIAACVNSDEGDLGMPLVFAIADAIAGVG